MFLDLNQQSIAKMDSSSVLQIIERIFELNFMYMGLYPSDKVPQLTKYSFVVINSAPNNDRGKHWIMTARMDKTYYFLESLDKKEQLIP